MPTRRMTLGGVAAGVIDFACFGHGPDSGARGPSRSHDATGDMPLGVITAMAGSPEKTIARVRELGFSACQLIVSNLSAEAAAALRSALGAHGVAATAAVCLGPGALSWNLADGPSTGGLVPRLWRRQRVERLKAAADFCAHAGIPAVLSHFGFIPEDPRSELYREFIPAMREVAVHAKERGIFIYFETGQETPITLLRTVRDVGTDNLAVNYDCANLILYGKGSAVDGLDVLGPYVRSVHAKDGLYPTDPGGLGREVPIGEGKVDFPRFIRRLKEIHFRGHIIIEREISGPQQAEDIRKSKSFLETLIRSA